MKLYYFPSPNPQKIRFAVNELGIECEPVPVDLLKREQKSPEFLALNPYGRVPVLVDGNSDPLGVARDPGVSRCRRRAGFWPTTPAGRADARCAGCSF